MIDIGDLGIGTAATNNPPEMPTKKRKRRQQQEGSPPAKCRKTRSTKSYVVSSWESSPGVDADVFEQTTANWEKRSANIKRMYVLKIQPKNPQQENPEGEEEDTQIWRKLCLRSNSTMYTLHSAIQTIFQLDDVHSHKFMSCNGVEIGIFTRKRLVYNERKVKLCQIHLFFFYLDTLFINLVHYSTLWMYFSL
eukprot:TRINITY_DN1198_c0_g1_i6.p1 TRINITY_DN1198_c0_g1~~TRINITY_DN1198_c0_g1_i6.p1  ORF type:complete len:193 (-),score=31.81 TRINITY_DN1198_c0_g1_i6:464-1042(-)